MCLYYHVHAVRTTTLHAAERRRFEYGETCQQCGKAVDDSTHVASHVMTYPCVPFNCCIARLSLQTCCRSCNGKHQSSEAGTCCVPGFYSYGPGQRLEWVRPHFCCVVYDAGGSA